ncbi:hypothetical protein ACT7V1_001253 [Salmonella enterica subsp. enterica]|uniref:hypothetical protein n=1 Tax=Escherichia coli TaxID=562 RepID=UPI0015E4C2CE|nr:MULTISPECIES: hypothetical protein [Enterobacteriaceae]QLO06926.1 hypothetical protein HV141_26030 [Citrobacter freundii]VVY70116.1 Uncharacterised protein [Escherichia coli]VVZ77001.1 Uncharacterised protein [Escherichia coli]VWN02264.1 Uncharacterised protein [Escherichia coli]
MNKEAQNSVSEPEELITRISQIIKREDGSEVKITAQAAFGAGLTRSIDVYVLRRDNADSNWQGCNNRPKAGWRDMSVDEYIREGRSEMLKAVTPGEILKLTNAIGKPMSFIDELFPS